MRLAHGQLAEAQIQLHGLETDDYFAGWGTYKNVNSSQLPVDRSTGIRRHIQGLRRLDIKLVDIVMVSRWLPSGRLNPSNR